MRQGILVFPEGNHSHGQDDLEPCGFIAHRGQPRVVQHHLQPLALSAGQQRFAARRFGRVSSGGRAPLAFRQGPRARRDPAHCPHGPEMLTKRAAKGDVAVARNDPFVATDAQHLFRVGPGVGAKGDSVPAAVKGKAVHSRKISGVDARSVASL